MHILKVIDTESSINTWRSHELGQRVSISRASEELFVTVLASGMMQRDALIVVHIGREVVI